MNIPSAEINLVSRGIFYPEGNPLRSGKLTMKYATTKEEDILTNPNFIKSGDVIDKFISSLILDDIKYDDLLVGDRNQLIVYARILSYGAEYKFIYKNFNTSEEYELVCDLGQIKEKELDFSSINIEDFNGIKVIKYTLPISKVDVKFRLMTVELEKKINKEIESFRKISPNTVKEVSTRWKHLLVEVGGSREKSDINNFVDNMLALDSLALRNYYNSVTPDLIPIVKCKRTDNGVEEDVNILVNMDHNFFWPSL